MIIDLGSKAGTKVNNQLLQKWIPFPLKNNYEIICGMSTRKYLVKIDYTAVKKYL